jgi:putative membrane protein
LLGRYDGMADKVTKPTSKPAPKPAVAQAAKAARTLAESGKQVEKSTRKVTVEAKKVTATAERQVELAADRTLLATERTYAAWVRTALASLASGVGARALLQDYVPLWLAKLTGSVLVVFAGFCVVAAVWRHLFEAVPPPATDLRRVPRAVLLPMNAFLLLVAVAVLVGIWAG